MRRVILGRYNCTPTIANKTAMDDIYYIHDAGTGRILIANIGKEGDERWLERTAKREDMNWGDCSWGSISSMSINI